MTATKVGTPSGTILSLRHLDGRDYVLAEINNHNGRSFAAYYRSVSGKIDDYMYLGRSYEKAELAYCDALGFDQAEFVAPTTNNRIVTRKQVIAILARHSRTPDEQTATTRGANGEPAPVLSGSSFDEELGIHDYYSLDSVKGWLGY